MNARLRKCPECGDAALYTTRITAAGNNGPYLLPGLGGFLRYAKLDVVVCATCGLARFYAEEQARDKLSRAQQWKEL